MQIAQRIYSLGREQNDPALKVGAYRALAPTAYFLGDFETAREYALRGVEIWRSDLPDRTLDASRAPDLHTTQRVFTRGLEITQKVCRGCQSAVGPYL